MDKKFWESKKIKMALIGAGVEGLLAFLIALAATWEIVIPAEVLAYVAGIFGVSIGGQAGADIVRQKANGKQANLPQSSTPEVYAQGIEQPVVPQTSTGVPVMVTGTWSPDSVSEDIGEANGTTTARVDLDGLEQAFKQQLREAGETIVVDGVHVVNPTRLYSKFQARANTYDLRSVPLHERVDEALRWNNELITLARASFRSALKIEPPVTIASPRALLALIRGSKGCGEFVGSYERFHVYELYGLYQQRDALMNVGTFSWTGKFGNARVTPWQLAECAKGGLL